MIFGKDYDKSLYLIIKNNIRNKELVNDFLSLIPYEFIIRIQNDIIEYENYNLKNNEIIDNDSKLNNFNSEIYTSTGYLYSYYIDIENGLLSISRSVYQCGAYYKEFELKLFRCRNIDNYSVKNIGSISFGFNNMDNSYNCNYNISEYEFKVVKVPFKNMLFLLENNMLIGIDKDVMNNDELDDIRSNLCKNKIRCLRKD